MKFLSDTRVHLSADEALALAEQSLQKSATTRRKRASSPITWSMRRCAATNTRDCRKFSTSPSIASSSEPRRPMRALRETPVSVLFDGGNNNGMVTMYRATQAAIAKAREHGFAIVGVNNSWVSGRSAHYVEMVARAGLIGIHSVSSTRHVSRRRFAPARRPAPIRSRSAFRRAHEPLVIDLGTSAFMGTDLIFQERRSECCRRASRSTRRASRRAIRRACTAILPFGGYKGFALGIGDAGPRRARGLRDWVTTRPTAI